MTLPADKYLIEAQTVFYSAATLHEIKTNPAAYHYISTHARALERVAELEGLYRVVQHERNTACVQRDEALERIAGLQLALAKMVAFEPQEDPDLALADDLERKLYASGGVSFRAVDLIFAGIKAGRAGGGL